MGPVNNCKLKRDSRYTGKQIMRKEERRKVTDTGESQMFQEQRKRALALWDQSVIPFPLC